MKYKVKYTIYDCHEWFHTNHEEIIEADSEKEAKEKITSRSSMCSGEYMVNEIKEIN